MDPWRGQRVQALLIIDRPANIAGMDRTLDRFMSILDAMRDAGIQVEPAMMDSGVSPPAILDRLRRIQLGGQGVLLVYYLGHGATDPLRGHVLGTSGGQMDRSALVDAARGTGRVSWWC